MTGGPSLARSVASAAAAAIVAGLALAGGAALAASVPLTTGHVALDPTDAAVHRVGRLEFLGGLDLRSGARAFGGLSGLSVTAGGRLSAVSDRGHWFAASIVHDEAGRLVDLVEAEMAPLRDEEGRPVAGDWRDAEALERLADGGWLVSFERHHRVWRYPAAGGLDGPAAPFPTPKALALAPANGGLEALAPLTDGRILMLSQGPAQDDGARAGWLVGEGAAASRRWAIGRRRASSRRMRPCCPTATCWSSPASSA